MKNLLSLIVCLGLWLHASGQGEANNWFFGNNAGITFNNGAPVALAGNAMSAFEGCATISDGLGQILFYTNGLEVWDATNSVMANGSGLLGGQSSTQSGVVVPRPLSTNIYYIFSIPPNNGTSGLTYSEVDMTLNGGLGDVTTNKNVALVTPVAEKVTAVQHSNGTDIWVIVHESNTNNFFTFLVTAAGVQTTPINSTAGVALTGTDFAGYMKASPNGDLLALSRYGAKFVDLFNFDATNGTISGPLVELPNNSGSPYGVEFSPNGNYLYGSGDGSNEIQQWDLTQLTPTDIINSKTVIATSASFTVGALQVGPDSKIYCTKTGSTHLGVIDQPNQLGVASNYIDSAVFLNGPTSSYGLPNFIQSFFSASITATNFCLNDTTFFALGDTTGVDSLFWNFGDTASGAFNLSQDLFPGHVFTDTGTFLVEVVVWIDTIPDTAFINVTILGVPQPFDLGNDTLLCFPDTLILSTGLDSSFNFLWQDSSTAPTFLVDSSGLYRVEVSNVCGVEVDSIQVTFDSLPPIVDLGPDTLVCGSGSYVLDPNLNRVNYLWQDGSTDTIFTVTQSDTFWLVVSNGCGSDTDTVVVSVEPFVQFTLPNDTAICAGDSLVVNLPIQNGVVFQWQDGFSTPQFTVSDSMTIWVEGRSGCDTLRDSLRVELIPLPQVDLGPDTVICDTFDLTLDASAFGLTYLWQDSITTTPTLDIELPGLYWVAASNGQCTVVDSILISSSFEDCFPEFDCALLFPNVFTPNGDGVNDGFAITSECNFTEYSLSIFNRWGGLVHRSRAAGIEWDGTSDGVQVPEGVYYWVLEYRHLVVVDADRQAKSGSITLLR